MSERALLQLVRKHLDRSAEELPTTVAKRLDAARERALLQQKEEGTVWALAGIGWATGLWAFPAQLFAKLALLLLLFSALSFFHSQQHIATLQDVDSKILTGDLPLDAYLDKDFNAWLRRSGRL